MQILQKSLPETYIIKPRVIGDERGFFMETYQAKKFIEFGLPADFVQDTHSGSSRGNLRGLPYQIQHAQGKLVRVVAGSVFDVAEDLRKSSPTFEKWVGKIQ